jgi:hypothetical protein
MARPFSAVSQFILAQPFDVSLADVVALARKAGHEIDTADVSRVRWRAKRRATAPEPAAPRGRPRIRRARPADGERPALLAPVPRDDDKLAQLRRLIVAVGCDAAVEVLAAVVADTRVKFDRLAVELR